MRALTLILALGFTLAASGAALAQSKCDAGKAKEAGKRVACKLKVHSKALKKGQPIDTAKLAKCETKFNDNCAKAELKGDCTNPGNCPTLAQRADDHVEDVVSGVVPLCGIYSKCVFVTYELFDGDIGGLDGADAECQAAADRLGANPALQGKTFKAWLSDSTTDARDRLYHAVVPYRLVDGTQIAADWNDLIDGSLDNPIDVNETHNITPAPPEVWTATYPDGTYSEWNFEPPCADWTTAHIDSGAAAGRADMTDDGWTHLGVASCSFPQHLYCFEQ
jgi:hypothetical protein